MLPPSKNRAFLSLGSNIEPDQNLRRAVELLQAYGDVVAVSSAWQSAPVGDTDQANFINAAVLLETPLSAEELKQTAMAQIETDLKRVRDPQNKNAARTIDLDLSLFNDDVLVLDGRTIPDEDILKRPFVAIPLAELEPGYLHPMEKVTLEEIAQRFTLSEWGMVRDVEITLE
ncbi:Bifunctional folate synthesis protein [Polystyrenella longa]|uniref:2-amino-4-hydroxy-6-hydroxymethyldihydropteridine pyrophosphokinase n=1 Tax=Polystyrenella longa TaxID=2528007 RepID=A0A518CIE0_9PLAN|nr:2-amino-4-hydroxy-6-hydroxymethyldihydropteridine diphosphokinase [Polystyrenella longa]QDU79006.1 Bifunctional folate synthesis protein [Polystyrenella longa]